MKKKSPVFILLVAGLLILATACQGERGATGPPGVPGVSGIIVLVECQDLDDPETTITRNMRVVDLLVKHGEKVELTYSVPAACGGGELTADLPLVEGQ